MSTRKPQPDRPQEVSTRKAPQRDHTITDLMDEIFRTRIANSNDALPLGKYVANMLWLRVLQGKKGAYRNWQKYCALVRQFDAVTPIIIQIVEREVQPPCHNSDGTRSHGL